MIHACVNPPDLRWLPPLQKEDYLPQNLCLDYSKNATSGSQLHFLLPQHWYKYLSQGMCSLSCTLHSWLQLPETVQAPLVHQPSSTGDVKLSTEQEKESCPTRMGQNSSGVWGIQSENEFVLYASLREICCHKSSYMSLTFCFLCQPQKQTKNPQTLQTAQLSWVSLPEVSMFQQAVSFSRICSQCLHSVAASSTIKAQWDTEGQNQSFSLAWQNKGNFPGCTWNSFK